MAAPNLQAIRDRLNKLNKGAGEKPNDIWKPKDEHDVRLLAYPGSEDPFLNVYFHFDIGDEPIYCPKANRGEDCDICDFCDKLRAWKGPDGNDKKESERKSDWELFKKIQVKANLYVPVAVRGEEAKGAKFWRVSQTLAGQLLDICAEGERLTEVGSDNPLDVLFSNEKAYDLAVVMKKPGEKGNTKTFNVTEAKGKIRPTPLSKDKKAAKDIMDSIKKIEDVFPPKTSDEVSKLFKRFLNAAAPAAKAEGGAEKYASKRKTESEEAPEADEPEQKPVKTFAANSKENAKLSGTKSIDEAFSELAGE